MEQEKSVARKVRAVKEVFPCIICPNDLKSVLNTLNSFKHLGREKEMQDFVQCCSDKINVVVNLLHCLLPTVTVL